MLILFGGAVLYSGPSMAGDHFVSFMKVVGKGQFAPPRFVFAWLFRWYGEIRHWAKLFFVSRAIFSGFASGFGGPHEGSFGSNNKSGLVVRIPTSY